MTDLTILQLNAILDTLSANRKRVDDHTDYPSKPGLYAIYKTNYTILEDFYQADNILYIGKAERSLNQRDLGAHFNSKYTGSSTLRRTLGALLKEELNLQAFTRNGKLNQNAIDHYTFCQGKDFIQEDKLTSWMKNNLLLGYWEYIPANDFPGLAKIERKLLDLAVPILNLDTQTRKLNKHAAKLVKLRNHCKSEAAMNAGLPSLNYENRPIK